MPIPITSIGGDHAYVIQAGAWTRGGNVKDLEVRVEYDADGRVDHVSLSHRSLTVQGVDALGLLIHTQAGRPELPGQDTPPPTAQGGDNNFGF